MTFINTRWRSFLPVALLIVGIFTGCQDDDRVPEPEYTLDQLYLRAIDDAMIAESTEIIDTLWSISPDNSGLQWKTINDKSYVLLASFTRYPSSYPEGDSVTNTWGASWLFIPLQMKRRIGSAFTPASDTIMRICQLLGLPPANENSNTHITEMWVPAEKLYRPAGNPAITTITTGATLVNNVSETYADWFNDYIIYAYYRSLPAEDGYHYPWTRLGYTYDWAPDAKEVGLNEYVLQAGSGAWVESTSTASDFFKN